MMCKEKTTNQIKLIHAIMLNFIGLMALKGYSQFDQVECLLLNPISYVLETKASFGLNAIFKIMNYYTVD